MHGTADAPRDEKTIRYFDGHTPEYSVERLRLAIDVLNRYGSPTSSLLDVGCGTGNTLEHIARSTSLTDLHGLDVSARCLERTHERVGCPTSLGSILDDRAVVALARQFDFVLVAAVLHHLIGRTRADSRTYAARAVRNALSLLKPDGRLIVLEPVFYPSLAMDVVFYLKKAVSGLTDRRVPLFEKWSNIGAPVVSYYTNEELVELLEASGATIEEREIEAATLPPPLRFVLRKTNTTLVARAAGALG